MWSEFILESKNKKENTSIIVDFLKMYWLKYVLGLIFLFLSAYVQSFNPKLLGIIIDLLDSPTIDRQFIIYNLGLLVMVAFLAFVTRYIWRYFIIGNARNMECYLRQRLFKHFQSLPVKFYNNRKTGDLMAYAINDVSAVKMSFGPSSFYDNKWDMLKRYIYNFYDQICKPLFDTDVLAAYTYNSYSYVQNR